MVVVGKSYMGVAFESTRILSYYSVPEQACAESKTFFFSCFWGGYFNVRKNKNRENPLPLNSSLCYFRPIIESFILKMAMKMKDLFGVILPIVSLFSGLHAQANGWHNIGGNFSKNGYANLIGPVTDSISWETTANGSFGAPLYFEGTRLVTMRFQSPNYSPVECFDVFNGNLLWSVDVTNNQGRSLPVGLRDGKVYVMRLTESQNDSLFALDLATGSRVWTSNVNVAAYISESGVFDSDGFFYIYGNFKTFKISPTDGQMIWQTPTIPMASGSGEMAINQTTNTGFTLEQNGGVSYVWAIDLSNGQKKYSVVVPEIQAGGNLPQSPLMVGNNGLIYVQLTEDNVAAIRDDGTQLTLIWQTPILGNSSFSTMCVGSDGSVYAPSNGKIIRLEPMTGSVLDSSVNISQGGFFSPRLSASNNDLIFATNGENGVYAFDLSLNLVWTDVLNFTNTSGVCLVDNGMAAVSGTNKVRLYRSTVPTSTAGLISTPFISFPNPSEGRFTVLVDQEMVGKDFSITDGLGKTILHGVATQSIPVDISVFPNGVYFLHVGSHDHSLKLLKQAGN
jgi:outer membrane protein assembly factor BamB